MYFVSFLALWKCILWPSQHFENEFLSSFALSLNPSKVKECASLSRFSSNVVPLICHPLSQMFSLSYQLRISFFCFWFKGSIYLSLITLIQTWNRFDWIRKVFPKGKESLHCGKEFPKPDKVLKTSILYQLWTNKLDPINFPAAQLQLCSSLLLQYILAYMLLFKQCKTVWTISTV